MCLALPKLPTAMAGQPSCWGRAALRTIVAETPAYTLQNRTCAITGSVASLWRLSLHVLLTGVQAKNAALAAAGAIVPESFEGLEGAVRQTFNRWGHTRDKVGGCHLL